MFMPCSACLGPTDPTPSPKTHTSFNLHPLTCIYQTNHPTDMINIFLGGKYRSNQEDHSTLMSRPQDPTTRSSSSSRRSARATTSSPLTRRASTLSVSRTTCRPLPRRWLTLRSQSRMRSAPRRWTRTRRARDPRPTLTIWTSPCTA